MLWATAIILFVLFALSFGIQTSGSLISLLLVLALISIVCDTVMERRWIKKVRG